MTDTAAWGTLPSWMREQLEAAPFAYSNLLPVQQVVIPFVNRTIASCMYMDVCLSAPTGSGKTLCYLIPMLTMIAQEKRQLNDTRLRGVILVPTKALGAQVFAVAKKMAQGTTISVVTACGEHAAKESSLLVRQVTFNNTDEDGDDVEPANVEAVDEADEEIPHDAVLQRLHDASATSVASGSTFFSKADIIITTPQRLLKHMGSTTGFHLRDLRMMVIDEADQILTGNTFTNFIGRILRIYENSMVSVFQGHSAAMPVLHKMLCSATLSSHIARISEVRLRNCKQFSLDSTGALLDQVDLTDAQNSVGSMAHISSKFSLPPKLTEHMMTTTDEDRPAVLLKLLRHIAAEQGKPPAAPAAAISSNTEEKADEEEGRQREEPAASIVLDSTSMGGCGKTVIVFCGQSDTARVLSKFLTKCGITALDFTSTSSVAERRRFVISGIAGKAVVLITTDALMRGVDLPGVGHVVMYDAPRSIQQFVHRVGRTARALKPGHAYMLLTKKGPSGTLADGEVAAYKALDKFLTRPQAPIYDRELLKLTAEDILEAKTKLEETQQQLQQSIVSGVVAAAPKRPAAPKITEKKRAREEVPAPA